LQLFIELILGYLHHIILPLLVKKRAGLAEVDAGYEMEKKGISS
jgi:hypothetical protein